MTVAGGRDEWFRIKFPDLKEANQTEETSDFVAAKHGGLPLVVTSSSIEKSKLEAFSIRD